MFLGQTQQVQAGDQRTALIPEDKRGLTYSSISVFILRRKVKQWKTATAIVQCRSMYTAFLYSKARRLTCLCNLDALWMGIRGKKLSGLRNYIWNNKKKIWFEQWQLKKKLRGTYVHNKDREIKQQWDLDGRIL